MSQNHTKKSFPALITIAALAIGTSAYGAAVYENFEITTVDNKLNGDAGGAGLSGNWAATNNAVATTNLTYGSLATSGEAVAPSGGAWNSGSPYVDIGGTSLNGLLNDNGELWMSFLYRYGTSAAGVRFAVGIGDSRIAQNGDLFNEDSALPPLEQVVEQGIGVADFTDGGNKGAIPTIWDDNDFDGNNVNGNPTFGNPGLSSGSNGNFGFSPTDSTTQLFVLHAQWGADGSTNDVVTLYTPGTDLVLGTAVASYQTIVSQDSFDTLFFSINRDSGDVLDEIRIGASYAEVTPVPEPGSLALLGLGGLCLVQRRRRGA